MRNHELFVARVGFALSSDSGWLVPLIMRADWPIGRFAVTKQGIQVATFFFGTSIDLAWESINGISPTLLGLCIHYQQDDVPYDLDLYSPLLWLRFRAVVRKQRLIIPVSKS